MKKRIFITACCFRAPGLKDFGDISRAMNNPDFNVPFTEIILSDRRSTFVSKLDLDKTSPHYPSGSSLKVLRSDVIAAIICSGELLEQTGLTSADMLDVPLYISNGSSFDLNMEQVAEITVAYLPQSGDDQLSNRYQRINAALPPLFVLRTLANSTECFVSQNTGVKGDNATFGSTSHATYLALQEGIRKIENNDSEMVLVGASNGIGIFSSFIFGNFPSAGFQWRESEGAGFFLLESEENSRISGHRPMAEIVSLRSAKHIPDIFSDQMNEFPYQSFNHDLSDFCIYTGGLSRRDHDLEEISCKSKWTQRFSWFNQLGITGNNAILMNIATSLAIFDQKKARQIDCLNRDSYGRESFIKLKAFGD